MGKTEEGKRGVERGRSRKGMREWERGDKGIRRVGKRKGRKE